MQAVAGSSGRCDTTLFGPSRPGRDDAARPTRAWLRNFSAAMRNQVRLADITYIGTDQGWLYLAAIMDLYSRRIVGWAVR